MHLSFGGHDASVFSGIKVLLCHLGWESRHMSHSGRGYLATVPNLGRGTDTVLQTKTGFTRRLECGQEWTHRRPPRYARGTSLVIELWINPYPRQRLQRSNLSHDRGCPLLRGVYKSHGENALELLTCMY